MRIDRPGYLTHSKLYLLSSTGKAEQYSHCRIKKKKRCRKKIRWKERGEKKGEGGGRDKVHVCQQSTLMKVKGKSKSPAERGPERVSARQSLVG